MLRDSGNIEFAKSLEILHILHFPWLTGPSAGLMIQWWAWLGAEVSGLWDIFALPVVAFTHTWPPSSTLLHLPCLSVKPQYLIVG